jgi:RNA recognition motif-containing protein
MKKKNEKEKKMQGSKLYVGNFSYSVTEEDLREMFSSHGEVKEVKVIEGKGFGFVEMSSPSEAEKAKEALNGSNHKGRTLRVDEARPPRERGFGGRGRGGDRGGYRRY